MSELLAAALAAFVVEMAKSAGHETGIKVVAALGPYLTEEAAGKAWHALVTACQHASERAQAAGGTVLPPEEWASSLPIHVDNPLVPPDPGVM